MKWRQKDDVTQSSCAGKAATIQPVAVSWQAARKSENSHTGWLWLRG